MMLPTRLDFDWMFHLGDHFGFQDVTYNSSDWRRVSLPHDWSIEDNPDIGRPFDAELSGGKAATGYAIGGVGLYRREIVCPEDANWIELSFDGVYGETEVFVDGNLVKHHFHGYSPFSIELDSSPNRVHVIALRVSNLGHNARWYSGSGMYRPVTMRSGNSARIPFGGMTITTSHNVVDLAVEIQSSETFEAQVEFNLVDPSGSIVTSRLLPVSLAPGKTTVAKTALVVDNPLQWLPWDMSVDPTLAQPIYTILATVQDNSYKYTTYSSNFGFREFEYDATEGLRINRRSIKLKGCCVHHDHGPLGACAYDRAEERKVLLLKQAGFNAIRTSHNPPSTTFLDICEREGIVVIDELFDEWERPKHPDGYSNHFASDYPNVIHETVRRDRNRACVFAWSIGNEIPGSFEQPEIAPRLRAEVLRHDPTRPINAGLCRPWWQSEVWVDWQTSSDIGFECLDIGGLNYLDHEYDADHIRHPNRTWMGTETHPLRAWENWDQVIRNPYIFGDFVWTAMDYIGESGIGVRFLGADAPPVGEYPFHLAVCGDFDLIGDRKPQSFHREALWRAGVLRMAVRRSYEAMGVSENTSWHRAWGWTEAVESWTWPSQEGETLTVEICSSFDRVELWLNDELIGEAMTGWDQHHQAVFEVPYKPGRLVLKGISQTDRKEFVLATAREKAQLELEPDRSNLKANSQDLCFIGISVVDDEGTLCPSANERVEIEVSGPGTLVGFGNADPNDVSSVQNAEHLTYHGRAQAVIRADGEGEIRVIAKSSFDQKELLVTAKD